MAIHPFELQILKGAIDRGEVSYNKVNQEWKIELERSGYTPPKPKQKEAVNLRANIGDFKRNEFESPAAKAKVAPVAGPQKRSIPEQLLRDVLLTSDNVIKGATAGLLGPGGGLEQGISKLTGGRFQPFKPIQPENTAEKIIAGGANLGGSIAPIGAIYKPVKAMVDASKLVKGGSRLGKLAQMAVPGAVSNAAYEGARSAFKGEPLSEIAKDTAIGGVLGGVGDVAVTGMVKGVGRGVGRLDDFLANRKAVKAVTPVVDDVIPTPKANVASVANDIASAVDGVGVADNAPGNLSHMDYVLEDVLSLRNKTLADIDKMKKEIASGMYGTERASNREGSIYKQVLDRGGIAHNEFYNGQYAKEIPVAVKRQGGQTLDEMASSLDMTANELIEALSSKGVTRKGRLSDYYADAERYLLNDSKYNEMLDTINNVDNFLLENGYKASDEKMILANIAARRNMPNTKSDKLMGVGSISAAKRYMPGKMEPTGNPNEYVRSFNITAYDSPKTGAELKGMLWWGTQPGEAGTYIGRTHDMLSEQALRFISDSPDKALQHAMSYETMVNEPDLSVALGIKLAEHHQGIGNIEAADDILSFVSEQLTKHGQAISAARLIQKMSPIGVSKTVQANIDNLNKEGLKVYGKKWKEVRLLDSELALIDKLKPGDEEAYRETLETIYNRIADGMEGTAWEKINAWRHMSMLLNPVTAGRNIIGNGIMAGMRRSAKQVSAVLQNIFLTPTERTQVLRVNESYKHMAKAYYEANSEGLLNGTVGSKFRENITLNMPNKRVFKSNALEGARKLTYKSLEIGDTPFFKNAYINRLASYAQAKGVKNLGELPEDAFATALLEAEQATYTDASKLASYINKARTITSDSSLGEKAIALGAEAVIPFAKTPINIVKRGIQYSPAGIINGLSMIKSQKTAAKGIDELAKGLTGTGVMGLGYLLAKANILEGKLSDDKDKKAYEQSTGKNAFTVLGKYGYDWAQPFSIPLSMGVEIYNSLQKNPLELKKMDKVIESNDTSKLMQVATAVSKGIYEALEASGDTVFGLSVLQGISRILGNSKGIVAGIAQTVPQGYVSQFIPTASKRVAGLIDPTVRRSYVEGNLPESIKATVLSGIPGVSRYAEPRQTPFGQDFKRTENIPLRTFTQLISPANVAVDQGIDQSISRELDRLGEQGLTNQYPTMVKNYIEETTKTPRINLTPRETTQYQKRVGELTQAEFKKLIGSFRYNSARPNRNSNKSVDEVKADMLAKAISESKAKAKREILKRKGYKAAK